MNNLIYVFVLVTIFDLFAVTKKSQNLEICSKVLLMPTLFLSFAFVTSNKMLLAVGLFYTLGDALLLSRKFPCFMAGAISFLIGHIFYYTQLVQYINKSYLPFAILAGVLFLVYYWHIIFKDKQILNYLELAYIVFVDMLFVFSFAAGSTVMTLGAYLFAFSDILVVKSKNDERVDNSDFKIMFTYILGNFILLYGQYLMHR